ncbi:hypothetical protein [Rhodococcus marinonascens]|uniref:hypothetical protein n=1 Tax=Rhodococcus marinonascens TaxID=38311 RepID=UPI000933DA28|nr:hypothetical protein [Rhodococcus marinonascens]
MGLLLAHQTIRSDRSVDLPQFNIQQLVELSKYGVSGVAASCSDCKNAHKPVGGIAGRYSGTRRCWDSAACDRRIGSEYDKRIIDSPVDFPLEWFLAAEQRVSREAGNDPLESMAADNHWFSL